MVVCDSCKRLAGGPLRRQVPGHLRRIDAGDAPGARADRSGYFRCSECQSRWRWAPSGIWYLMLPQEPAEAPRATGPRSWTGVLSRLLARRAAGRAPAAVLRPPRLTPRGPAPPPTSTAAPPGAPARRDGP